MITSLCNKSIPFVSKRVKLIFNSYTRHYSWFRSKSDSSKADNIKVQVVYAPEMIPDDASNNPALILPKGEQQMIPFNDITPISSLRAFLKNVTQFDATLEEIISGADRLSTRQIMEKIDSALVSMRYSLNLAHVLTYAYPADYKYGVLDDMYHSYLKHDVNRFNPLTYQTACEIIESTKGTNSNEDLRQLGQFYRSQGKLYGFHLNLSAQENVAEYYRNIQTSVNKFITSVNKCINNEAVVISDENVIKSLPKSFATKLFTRGGVIRLPLHPTAYEIFMTYCPDKSFRRKIWSAYNSKPQMTSGVNNSVELEKARDYRHKLANTLGHINYAEMIVSRKMAGSVEVVTKMLNSISERISVKYEQDLLEIGDEKGRKSIGQLELWDLPFLKNISLNRKFGAKIDVARYFPLEKVISGTFQLVKNIFDVQIEQVNSDQCQLWSPHVKFYRLVDSNGQILGHFYFDPYCQRADRYGSNIIELTNRTKTLETTPLVAAFLSKKLPITKEQQILLSYPEYLSFLSMMGRIITIIMTNHNYFELSTIYNIPKDRLDSLGHALLLYGLHNLKAVQLCSSNITNGEPLPEQTHNLLRQYILSYESIGLTNDIFLSAMDLAFYTNTEFWRDIVPEVWRKYMKHFELPKEYAYPISFNEIVSNDGSSSYYSKIWSQMIASDICAALLEGETTDGLKEVGKNLRNTILSSNLSLSSADLFREFRGRDPSLAPLLDLHDLTTQAKLTQS